MSYRTNQYAATCSRCGGRIAPREGRLLASRPDGTWDCAHHDCAHRQPAPVVRAADTPRLYVFAMGGNGRWYRRNSQPLTYDAATVLACRVRREDWAEVRISSTDPELRPATPRAVWPVLARR